MRLATVRITQDSSSVSGAGVSAIPIANADGTALLPSYTYSADTNSGEYRIGSDNIAWSTGGTLRFDISTTLATMTLPLATPSPMATQTSTYTVALTDLDGTVLDATDNAVITLPAIAAGNKGGRVTIVNSAANGAAKISISPAAADAIVGTVMAISSGGVTNKDWISTKVTAKQGDYTTLVSDGTHTWFIVAGVGVWASEA